MRDEIPVLLSTSEVAGVFQVSCATIRRWRAEGKLRAVRVGRALRFPPADVQRLAEPQSEGAHEEFQGSGAAASAA
jgi:excisionase family DNA binding protein